VDFAMIAHFYGLVPSDLGREIQIAGKTYTIHGVKGSGKRPLVLRRADGVLFRFPEQSVIQALGLPWPLPMGARWSTARAAEWRANPAPALRLAETVEILRKIEAADASNNSAELSEAMTLRDQVAREVEVRAKALISKMTAKAATKTAEPTDASWKPALTEA
jgi:hypothetical protein